MQPGAPASHVQRCASLCIGGVDGVGAMCDDDGETLQRITHDSIVHGCPAFAVAHYGVTLKGPMWACGHARACVRACICASHVSGTVALRSSRENAHGRGGMGDIQ